MHTRLPARSEEWVTGHSPEPGTDRCPVAAAATVVLLVVCWYFRQCSDWSTWLWGTPRGWWAQPRGQLGAHHPLPTLWGELPMVTGMPSVCPLHSGGR